MQPSNPPAYPPQPQPQPQPYYQAPYNNAPNGYPPAPQPYGYAPQPGYGYQPPAPQNSPKGIAPWIYIVVGLVVVGLALTALVVLLPTPAPKIASAQTSRDYVDKKAVGATTVFATNTTVVHAVVKVDNALATSKVKAVWIAVDAGGEQNFKIADKELQTEKGDNIVDFTLTLDEGLPQGKYKVELYLDNKFDRSLEFTVQ